MLAFQSRTAPASRIRFLPRVTLRGLVDAVIEADRRFRETRRLERLDYPHLRDMGIDLGRIRDTSPRG